MIVFIIIITITIFTAVMLPVLSAGSGFAINFQYITFPMILIMGFLLIGITIFFLLNYRLLSLLEREDWPALSYYLEQIIYVKGRYSAYKVKLLASSYLVITDYASVLKLESKAMLAKPLVVEKNALLFGAARVLSGDSKGAAAFFHTYMDKGKSYERQWMHWFFGFSQLLAGEFSSAEREFMSMAVSSKDALITGLSSYFLQSSVAKYSLRSEECRSVAENGCKRITKSIKTIDLWTKEADKMGTDIHIAIVRKYIDEAGNWIFSINKINNEQIDSSLNKEEDHNE